MGGGAPSHYSAPPQRGRPAAYSCLMAPSCHSASGLLPRGSGRCFARTKTCRLSTAIIAAFHLRAPKQRRPPPPPARSGPPLGAPQAAWLLTLFQFSGFGLMDCQTTSWDSKIRFRTKIFIRLCHLAAPLLADAAGPGARFESFGLLLIHAPPTLFCNSLKARPRLLPLKGRKQK